MPLTSTRALLFATGCLLGWQLCSIAAQIASLTLCFLSFHLLSSNEQAREILCKVGPERSDGRNRQSGRLTSPVERINFRKSTGQHSRESGRNSRNVIQPDAGDSTYASLLKSRERLHPSSSRGTHSAHQLLMNRDEGNFVLAWRQTVDRPELEELRRPSPTSAADIGPVPPLTAERLAKHIGSPNGGSTSCRSGSEASSCSISSQLIDPSPFTSVVPISSTVSKEARGPASSPPLLFKKARKTASGLYRTQPGCTLRADTKAHLEPECSNESDNSTTSMFADRSSFSSRQTCAFQNELPALSSAKRTCKSLESPPYPIGHERAFISRREADDDDIKDMAQVDQSTRLASRSLKEHARNNSAMDKTICVSTFLAPSPRAKTMPFSSHRLKYQDGDSMNTIVADTSNASGGSVSVERLLDLITKLRE